jgi:exodeoxyribonuclease VII small subunit
MELTDDPRRYEIAYAELQQIVQDLQEERVGIDELAEKIARAGELIRFCRERLRTAEDEVGKLSDAIKGG